MSVSDRLIRQEERENTVRLKLWSGVLFAVVAILAVIFYLLPQQADQNSQPVTKDRLWREKAAYYALVLIYQGQVEFKRWKFSRDSGGNPSFASSLDELLSKGVVDLEFYSLEKNSAFDFHIKLVTHSDGTQGFVALAIPEIESEKWRQFYVDERGIVRFSQGLKPDETSPAIEWKRDFKRIFSPKKKH